MFVSERLVYIELQKTGCTHIRNILSEAVGGTFTGKHDQATEDLLSQDRFILGSIRDPWEWYTSLWAYGCDAKGGVYGATTRGGLAIRGLGWTTNPINALRKLLAARPRVWMRTYRNVNDAGAFRAWLNMVHDEHYLQDIGEGYGNSPISAIAGLLTFRYLKLFCTTRGDLSRLNDLTNFQKIEDFENKNCFVDFFVRNESLVSDLLRALDQSGVRISNEAKEKILSRPRSNVSSRSNPPDFYYDASTERLVAEREQTLIRKFGYVAPRETCWEHSESADV